MKPMVATNALIDTKVVRSAVVVAFEMYVMHKVTDPAAIPTMRRATIIQ